MISDKKKILLRTSEFLFLCFFLSDISEIVGCLFYLEIHSFILNDIGMTL